MNIGLVCTTIGKGEFLEAYCKQAEKEGLKDNVTFYIVPDQKTPKELYEQCFEMTKQGFNVRCDSIDAQNAWLKKHDFDHMIPFNSDNRRNYGYLQCYADENDILISIDDDNLCIGDFFKKHVERLQRYEVCVPATSSNRWYNICSRLLNSKGPLEVFPRGHPQMFQHFSKGLDSRKAFKIKVAVNAGLWTEYPDLDAMTWLGNRHLRVHEAIEDPLILAHDTWAPINSQNTAIVRDAIPAYYFIPMSDTFDRYGDIFQGYFLEACVKAQNHFISYGAPIVKHVRNSHNYFKDLEKELPAMKLNEELCSWITYQKISNGGYISAYEALALRIEDWCERVDFSPSVKAYWHRVSYCMQKWLSTIEVM